MSGRWVALEGGEGCGKSTQARLLGDAIGALVTREPGGTPVGQRVRAMLLDREVRDLDERAEALLMAADRAQHLREVVEPALRAGRDVVSDRSAMSSLAYQGYGRGLGLDDLRWLSAWASRARWPDLVILLEVSDATARGRLRARAAGRGGSTPDRLELEGGGFHDRVRDGFRALAADDPDRWRVVDGEGPLDAVAARVTRTWEQFASR